MSQAKCSTFYLFSVFISFKFSNCLRYVIRLFDILSLVSEMAIMIFVLLLWPSLTFKHTFATFD